MQLYNNNLSPFASRCRMQVRAKNIPVELVAVPENRASINPVGKIPALHVDGRIIPESEVICEYLEDRFPEPSLRPANAEDRALMRTLSRIADLYVLTPLFALFGQMNPAARNAALVTEKSAELMKGLDQLEYFIAGESYAVDNRLTLADCTLAPALFFVAAIMPLFGEADVLAARPKLKSYWQNIGKDPIAAGVLAEMGQAMQQRMGK